MLSQGYVGTLGVESNLRMIRHVSIGHCPCEDWRFMAPKLLDPGIDHERKTLPSAFRRHEQFPDCFRSQERLERHIVTLGRLSHLVRQVPQQVLVLGPQNARGGWTAGLNNHRRKKWRRSRRNPPPPAVSGRKIKMTDSLFICCCCAAVSAVRTR